MSLPAHNRRWWEQLDFLAPDVRRDYGRILTQLERGFSTLATAPQAGHPAGWSGLSRRGNWDRLITSEWALAEVAPEEFIRRAGQGELSYWQMAQEAQSQNQTVWVWLDVGPDQLGACRLVQLALLFLLQQICQRSGGSFCWGMIQTPQKGYDQLGHDEVKTYLKARSLDPGRRPPEAPGGLQSWCIGSPNWLTQVPASYQRVSLLQISPERVEVHYRQRRLSLQMPPADRAVRLLRDPFSLPVPPVVPKTPLDSYGQLMFSQCGRKLMVVEAERILVIPLPSSPSDLPGKTRVFKLRYLGKIMAVSWERHALNVAQQVDDHWTVCRLNPATVQQDGFLRVPAPEEFDGDLGCCWPTQGGWFLWVGGQLWKLGPAMVECQFRTCGGSILGSAAALARDDGEQLVNTAGEVLYTAPMQSYRSILVCDAYGFGVTSTGQAVALELDGNRWRLLWKDQSASFPCQGKVVGLVAHWRHRQPGLLVQHAHHYVIQGADWSEVLDIGFLLAESLLHPNGLLVYRTQGGQLRCYSFPLQAHLWASSP